MRARLLLAGVASGAGTLLFGALAQATTYQVGAGKEYAALSEVVDGLAPGDVVEIAGDATYSEDVTIDASGSASAKITIRGVPVNGHPPTLSGSIQVDGDHIVLEGLEITGGAPVCLRHGGDDLTVRSTIVHDCPNHGILGTDQGSGSLLLQYVEVHHTATEQTGNKKHQIYIATDEVAHPGSVFRLESSYIHDCGSGGSNIKSRAERTEIYYNWIENGGLYEVELYGPDQDGVPGGWSEDLAREDADIVGNVFFRSENQATDFLFRAGGDGAPDLGDAGNNDTKGRVRFDHNTVIAPQGTGVFRTFNRLDSIEVHNTVFLGTGGGLRMLEDEGQWVGGSSLVIGDHNWIAEGTTDVPADWTDTQMGSDPGLADLAGLDLRPTMSSPLVDASALPTMSPSGHDFPTPLAAPLLEPPGQKLLAADTAPSRPLVGTVDLGAFEFGVGTAQPDGGGTASSGSGSGASGEGSSAAGDASSGDDAEEGGCGCTLRRGADAEYAGVLLAAAWLIVRRRRLARRRGRARINGR